MHEFTFISENLNLSATIFVPASKKAKSPAILFVHGWTSVKERSYQYAEALSKLGYICMLFDMRGHGASEGNINKATPKEFLDDVLAAYDYLKNVESIDDQNISVISSSFGGYLGAILTTKRKIKNLSLRVPADYSNDVFNVSKMESGGGENKKIMAWRKLPKRPSETFALEAIANFEGNIQIIESEKDDQVPHETLQNFVNAVKDKNKLSYTIMKDAPHSMNDGPLKNEVEQLLVKWFGDKLK